MRVGKVTIRKRGTWQVEQDLVHAVMIWGYSRFDRILDLQFLAQDMLYHLESYVLNRSYVFDVCDKYALASPKGTIPSASAASLGFLANNHYWEIHFNLLGTWVLCKDGESVSQGCF